jgi:hypothetical protein
VGLFDRFFRSTPGRSFGYLRTPRDSRDQPIEVLNLSVNLDTPPSVSIRHPAVVVRQQYPNNSCLAFAVAQGIELAYAQQGILTGDLSARAPYFWSRAAQGLLPQDNGSAPRPTMNAVMRFGIPTEKTCPTSGQLINMAPSWRAYQEARDIGRGLRSYAWIGSDDIDTMKRCLRDGVPVLGGWPCDKAFLQYAGGKVLGPPTGEIIGDHAMLLTGYYDDGTFDLFNQSWPFWGDPGSYARVTEEYVRCAIECWGLAVLPSPSPAA